MTPKIVDKGQRRGEILAAAMRVFARKGYAATRIGDIAGEAGIAHGTVYLYFSSRDEILVAAFDEFQSRLLTGVRMVLEYEAPALDKLQSGIQVVLREMAAEPDLSRVVLDFWSASAFENRAPQIDFGAVYGEYRSIIAGLLDEARREGSVRQDLPDDTPAVIVGVVEGMFLQWIADPDAIHLDETACPILQVLLGGLKNGEAD